MDTLIHFDKVKKINSKRYILGKFVKVKKFHLSYSYWKYFYYLIFIFNKCLLLMFYFINIIIYFINVSITIKVISYNHSILSHFLIIRRANKTYMGMQDVLIVAGCLSFMTLSSKIRRLEARQKWIVNS